jgi:hypothetical protein
MSASVCAGIVSKSGVLIGQRDGSYCLSLGEPRVSRVELKDAASMLSRFAGCMAGPQAGVAICRGIEEQDLIDALDNAIPIFSTSVEDGAGFGVLKRKKENIPDHSKSDLRIAPLIGIPVL